MKLFLKSLISLILVLSMMLSTALTASAMFEIEEEYISDLRLIYANTYEEAKLILADSKLKNYRVLNQNLNAYSGEVGVWLVYKTTKNINDAITDIAVMQMGGGYKAANYQAMLSEIRADYLEMGELYLLAIDYFSNAYDAGDFLAEAAYRQLNFYVGMDKYPDECLGDLFTYGVLRKNDAANLFFEGNPNIVENIRTLLAMGVSYNEDGMHYLERVDKLVAEMGEGTGLEAFKNSDVEIYIYSENELATLAQFIVPNIVVFHDMFEELEAYESELNYEDEDMTDLEIKYAEYKAIAEMMRSVDYIGGQTLYDFCMEYVLDISDYTSLYPLAAALNEGQMAMTQLAHYYDVVRYSMSEYPEEHIDEEIAKLEEQYLNNPIDVYVGIDRSLYEGTFALTPNAHRANAYKDSNALGNCLFGGMDLWGAKMHMNMGSTSIGLSVWAVVRSNNNGSAEFAKGLSKKAAEKLEEKTLKALKELEETPLNETHTYGSYVEHMYAQVDQTLGDDMADDFVNAWNSSTNMVDKVMALKNAFYAFKLPTDTFDVGVMQGVCTSTYSVISEMMETAQKKTVEELLAWSQRLWDTAINGWGAYSSATSAWAYYKKIKDHYYPKYDEVPMIMVDVVSTDSDDIYVKYDVVLEVQKKDGEYHAADLNAFAGERWNALYFTKSANAGKPLLADFVFSNHVNRADDGYNPVHRFGEEICYDLNKYNFSSNSAMIFLSVGQSENQKYDVETTPKLIGSLFGEDLWLIVGCAGMLVGAGCTMSVISILKRKKKKTQIQAAVEAAD